MYEIIGSNFSMIIIKKIIMFHTKDHLAFIICFQILNTNNIEP